MVTERIPLLDEALIALVIWAIFPIDHVLGDAIKGTALVGSLPGLLAPTTAYLVSITVTILGFTAVNRLASTWGGLDWRASFTKFGSPTSRSASCFRSDPTLSGGCWKTVSRR